MPKSCLSSPLPHGQLTICEVCGTPKVQPYPNLTEVLTGVTRRQLDARQYILRSFISPSNHPEPWIIAQSRHRLNPKKLQNGPLRPLRTSISGSKTFTKWSQVPLLSFSACFSLLNLVFEVWKLDFTTVFDDLEPLTVVALPIPAHLSLEPQHPTLPWLYKGVTRCYKVLLRYYIMWFVVLYEPSNHPKPSTIARSRHRLNWPN